MTIFVYCQILLLNSVIYSVTFSVIISVTFSVIISVIRILNLLYYDPVSRQPVHAFQQVFAQPPCRLMLLQRQTSALHAAPEAMHRQVKLRVVPLHRFHESFHHYSRFQFLPYFPFQRLLSALPGLHLPPGKLPAILHVAISPLCGEDPSLVVMYDGRYYLYPFHLFIHRSYKVIISIPFLSCRPVSIVVMLPLLFLRISATKYSVPFVYQQKHNRHYMHQKHIPPWSNAQQYTHDKDIHNQINQTTYPISSFSLIVSIPPQR